ncbi:MULTISPECIES: hypothetical protein [Streptomyces]|uniref:Uncharacterized protein n=1 Tax=Streptomyces xanthii TaxID=2768069 RepID=A0A7H1BCR8_9ACTN|nr:hypothetical protein [Streptomyces xanthii]QNS06523.1 hypothetical protein IAG42_25020 [Streptomyces xanthii]
MNIRSLTRGDGVVIGAAVLLFIASFLEFYSYSGSNFGGSASADIDGPNAWDNLGYGLGTFMGGVIGAALIVFNRAQPQPRKVLGLDLGMVGTGFAVLTAWTMLWTLIDVSDNLDAGAGLIIGLIASLALAGGAVAGSLVPALKAPLVGAPRPVQPQPYGGQPQGGYGYPGAQQQPGQPYGAQQGQPGPGQPYGGQPQPQAAAPAPQPAQPSQGGQPAGDFSPFWFAVPVPRPLYAEDGSPSPIAELAPGTWYLAVEQRGPGLVAQTQDGRRGVLQDTSGIQRG